MKDPHCSIVSLSKVDFKNIFGYLKIVAKFGEDYQKKLSQTENLKYSKHSLLKSQNEWQNIFEFWIITELGMVGSINNIDNDVY